MEWGKLFALRRSSKVRFHPSVLISLKKKLTFPDSITCKYENVL